MQYGKILMTLGTLAIAASPSVDKKMYNLERPDGTNVLVDSRTRRIYVSHQDTNGMVHLDTLFTGCMADTIVIDGSNKLRAEYNSQFAAVVAEHKRQKENFSINYSSLGLLGGCKIR